MSKLTKSLNNFIEAVWDDYLERNKSPFNSNPFIANLHGCDKDPCLNEHMIVAYGHGTKEVTNDEVIIRFKLKEKL